MPAGTHTLVWEVRRPNGSRMPAGLYLVRAKEGDRATLSRVVLIP